MKKVKFFVFDKLDNNFGLGIVLTKDVTGVLIGPYALYLWEKPL